VIREARALAARLRHRARGRGAQVKLAAARRLEREVDLAEIVCHRSAEFSGVSDDPRFMVIAHRPVASVPRLPRERLIVHAGDSAAGADARCGRRSIKPIDRVPY
jgi:hypothetical protein